MPYAKFTEDDKVVVYKVDDAGKPLGSHDTDKEADAQLAALNASEQKEGDHQKMHEVSEQTYSDDGPISFSELAKMQEAEEAGYKLNEMAYQFPIMVKRIFGREDIVDKDAALQTLTDEFLTFAQAALSNKERSRGLWTKIKRAVGISTEEKEKSLPEKTNKEAVSIWLNKETGQYQWLAAYSNNYRDDDHPAEIISAQSHKEFDEALEKSEWPMPDLWLWHIPYPVGKTHYHAFDEATGFTVAGGTFDKDKSYFAECLIKAGWNGVSHGMPKSEIKRDEKDKTVIVRHRTREISFLPSWAAANKYSFAVIKENDMTDETKGLPAHKRSEFVAAFGEDGVKQIEDDIARRASKAKEDGREQKELTVPQGEAEEQEDNVRPFSTEAKSFDEEALIARALVPVAKAMEEMAQQFDDFDNRLKELERADGERIARKAANTPAASLEAQVEGLFSKAAQVDGRTSIARNGPKEAEAKPQGGIFFEQWLGGQNNVATN